jgi:hypothetical protein
MDLASKKRVLLKVKQQAKDWRKDALKARVNKPKESIAPPEATETPATESLESPGLEETEAAEGTECTCQEDTCDDACESCKGSDHMVAGETKEDDAKGATFLERLLAAHHAGK